MNKVQIIRFLLESLSDLVSFDDAKNLLKSVNSIYPEFSGIAEALIIEELMKVNISFSREEISEKIAESED